MTETRDSSSYHTLPTPNFIHLIRPSTPIALIMQRTAYGISMLISCQPESKDPAPIEEGSRAGYFDDRLTRHLLALTSEKILLGSGTYGGDDLGQAPVDIIILKESSYDRKLLPFAPRGSCLAARNIDLHKVNNQWRTYAQTAKDLKSQLDEVIKEASIIAKQVALSLPEYARLLIPKLLYKADEEGEFPFQLQAFFTPTAICARIARIIRVIGLLAAYINLGHRILSNCSEWKFNEPVGLVVRSESLTEEDHELLKAYLYLGVPIECEGKLPLAVPRGYSLDDAKNALHGRDESNTPAQLSIDDSPEELGGSDDDALKFSVIFPEYDTEEYNSDGTRATKRQKKEKLRMLQEDAQASDEEEDSTTSPRPPRDEAMQMDSVASALGVTLSDEPVGGQVPSTPGGPSTAFASPAGSTSVSSSSSSNLTYPSGSRSSRRDTGSRPSRRSWHWANRQQRGPERSLEPSSSRRFEPYAGPSWRESARSQAYDLQVQRQPYRSSSMLDMRHQDAMTRYPYSSSPLPPPLAGVSAPVAARAEQNIIRDRGSGTLRTVTIIDTDFSQLGIPTGESATGGQWPGAQNQLPYGGSYAPSREPHVEYPYQHPHHWESAGPSQHRGRGSHRGNYRHRQQTWHHQAPPPSTPRVDPAQQWGTSSPQVHSGGQLNLPQPMQSWGFSTTSPSDPVPLTSASAPASVRPPVADLEAAASPTSSRPPPILPPSAQAETSSATSQPENSSSSLPGAQPPLN